tara:strand:- start:532 stop:789 length:258 start_codon:yes stop_codon:yes gene_type:complete
MPWKKDKERIKVNRERLLKYKKTLNCSYCGLQDHRVLEFHHLKDKDESISRMVNTGYGWKRIQNEITKCIPLCSNCHRIEHWKKT